MDPMWPNRSKMLWVVENGILGREQEGCVLVIQIQGLRTLWGLTGMEMERFHDDRKRGLLGCIFDVGVVGLGGGWEVLLVVSG